VEVAKTLTPSPSPAGEGNKKKLFLPFSCGRRGWGMRAGS